MEVLETRQLLAADPTNLSVALSQQNYGEPTQETISWNPSGTGATTFNIYRSTTAYSRGSLINSVTAGTGTYQQYVDNIASNAVSNVANPQIYFYTVTGVNGGNESAGGTQAYCPQMTYIAGYTDTSGPDVQRVYEGLGVEVHHYLEASPPAPSDLPSYGPLVLSGYSFGGDHANNISGNAGRTVDYLALVDPVPHNWPTPGNPWDIGHFYLASNVTYADDFYDDDKNHDPVPSGPIVGAGNYTNHVLNLNNNASLTYHGALVWDYPDVQSVIVAKINTLNWRLPMSSGVPAAATNVAVTTLSNTSLAIAWSDNSNNESSFQIQRSTSQNGTYTTVGTVGANVTSFTDNGLSTSVVYYYKITAVNGSGSSAPASGMGQTSVPNGPWGLTVSTNSSSSLHLLWYENAVNESNFIVQRATSSGGPYSTVATLPASTTTWDDSGLAGGTTYYYQVYATNAVGNSGATTALGTTTGGVTLPAAPSNLAVTTLSNTSLSLSWSDNSNNESSFQIQRSTSQNGTYTIVGTTAANVTSFTDSNLGVSVVYYYKVTAINDAGASAAASGMGETSVPNTPWGLTIDGATASSLNLRWAYNSINNTSIQIGRSTSPSGPFTTIATLAPTALAYSDSGLASGTTYYYQVSAVNAVGAGTTSGSGTTLSSLPAAPSNLTLRTLSNTAINLSWSDNASNESSYVLQRSTSQNGTYTTIATLAANSTSYSDSGLGVSVVYYYQLYASNASGASAVISGVGETSVPNGPWGLTVSTNSSSSLHLLWYENAVNETGFVVLRSSSLNGTYSTVAMLGANTTSWDDSGLLAGTTYYYQVYAINDVGSSGTTNASGTTSA